MKKRSFYTALTVATALCAASAIPADVLAATTGAAALPWESPMNKIAASITGPVAYGISLTSIAASGVGIIWGGDFNDFAKMAIKIALVVSLIVFAAQILSSLFGIGAVIS